MMVPLVQSNLQNHEQPHNGAACTMTAIANFHLSRKKKNQITPANRKTNKLGMETYPGGWEHAVSIQSDCQ